MKRHLLLHCHIQHDTKIKQEQQPKLIHIQPFFFVLEKSFNLIFHIKKVQNYVLFAYEND